VEPAGRQTFRAAGTGRELASDPVNELPQAEEDAGKDGVGFIDILFGVAASEVFIDLAAVPREQVAKWGHLLVALVLIAFSWIGYHKARTIAPAKLRFDHPAGLLQLGVDIGIVGTYFALVINAHGLADEYSMLAHSALIAVAYGLYLVWDLLGTRLDDAGAGERARVSGIWAALFVAVLIFWNIKGEPTTSAPVVVTDIFYVLAFYGYRLMMEHVTDG
jgi:hypothetical protein